MCEVGLINVALPNVVDDPLHPGAVLVVGEGGGDRVRLRLAKRGRGRLRLAKRAEVFGPKLDGGLRALGASVALLIQPGGDQPHLAELMIEHDEAVVNPTLHSGSSRSFRAVNGSRGSTNCFSS